MQKKKKTIRTPLMFCRHKERFVFTDFDFDSMHKQFSDAYKSSLLTMSEKKATSQTKIIQKNIFVVGKM